MSIKLKKLSAKQKRQLEKLVKENYQNWLSVAISYVGNSEAASEVVSKTLLYIVNRIVNKDLIPVNIPEAAGYVCIAVRCRSINYIRDSSKMITLSNFDLDKLASDKS